MRKIIAIYRIIRPVNIIISILSVIVGGIIAQHQNLIPLDLFWSAIAEALAFSAGNIINDIYDIEIDKVNRPERVLPSGKLTIPDATALYVICLLSSIFISFLVSKDVFLIIIITNILLYLYSSLIKKIVFASNLIVAVIFAAPFILGASSVGNVEAGIIPFIFAFFIHLSREIVKDMEDVQGDLSQNYKSFPSKFGFPKSVKLVIFITSILIILTIYPFVIELYSFLYFVIILFGLIPFLIYTLYKLYKDTSNKNLKKISLFLKLNMLVGLIAIYFA